jgi:hypothetical protein
MVATAIVVNYEPDGNDWTIEVSSGGGESRTGRASGLTGAREKADRLVAELVGTAVGSVRVVHLLHGDAVAFSSAYLSARLGIAPATREDAGSGSRANPPGRRSSSSGTDSSSPRQNTTSSSGSSTGRP